MLQMDSVCGIQTNKVIIARDVVFNEHRREIAREKKNVYVRLREEVENKEGQDTEEVQEIQELTDDEIEEEIPEQKEVEESKIKRVRKIPSKYQDCVLMTYQEAIAGVEKDKWITAIKEEKESLNKNNTWELVNENEAIKKKQMDI
ncbi:uncharacterized protein LOC111620271 [Centruroides sculpturatus]|uniref:uncharacterized protein LOC111620271 n=1 Tax=Centruroides sculpturatus TaxID=218467 RepID=UPI000C6DDC96|nr:uncharacterized protein LOC111620271 [Centruroides sculpturatus]